PDQLAPDRPHRDTTRRGRRPGGYGDTRFFAESSGMGPAARAACARTRKEDMLIRRLAALAAALGLTLMLASPALANTLHQTPPISAASAPQGTDTECAGLNLQPGQILWHFVHTMTDGSNLPATITVQFESGFFAPVSGYSNGGGNAEVMYDVITTAADGDLLGASDTI